MLHYPNISPIAFSIGSFHIYWYGVMYVIGFLIFWGLGKWRAQHGVLKIDSQWVDDLLFYGALSAIIGGRLGYVLFYQWEHFINDPIIVFKLWQGGMSFHGGLLGVMLAVWLFARSKHYSFVRLLDFVAPLVPLGLFAGRLGNFINGELWGRPSDVPWAMVFPHVDALPRHPSQLYEALLEGLLLFIIVWIYSSKPRACGRVAALFGILYATMRIGVEFVREPDRHIQFIAFGWLTLGQLLSILLFVLGMLLWYQSKRDPNIQGEK